MSNVDNNGSGTPDHGWGEDLETDVPREPAKVLLVDDHPANLLVLEGILEPLGHCLVKATSGEEALRALLHDDFALIILDVQMPGMDGFEIASLIKAHRRTAETPIIFVTALSRDTAQVFKGYNVGAVDYLLKPVDPDILRSKVTVFVDLYLRGEKIKVQQALLRRRERARLELQTGRRFRRLFESMPILVWITDPQGHVQFASRAWVEYCGRVPEEGEGIVESSAVHEDDVEAVRVAWADSIRDSSLLAIEYRLRRRDGAYRWHAGRAVPEYGDDGAVKGWIVTATDVDDQKRQGEERAQLLDLEQRARADAESANRSKDAFLATVSHELRAPLNAILGWSRMLSAGKLAPERVTHALATIERNALAQARLVEDILDVSRIISGKLRLQVERIKVSPLVHSAVEGVRPAAEAKHIELMCLAESDDEISGDPARLQQIVTNLVVNAVKFTPNGGHIEVRLRRLPSQFEIRVSDTGIGIDTESLPHVFERFRQVRSSNSVARTNGGLGLGLAVVRHLAERHGGCVTAESPGLGMGATFTVLLPATIAAVTRGAPEWFRSLESKRLALATATRLDNVTVLVVDDDVDSLDLVAEVLEGQGAVVSQAASVPEALEILRRSPPHVLVSDIGMPGEDGYALIRAVRDWERAGGTAHIPAVAVTAHAYHEGSDPALSESFEKHLAKPVEPSDLIALLGELTRPARA